jgi:hypothetical protein
MAEYRESLGNSVHVLIKQSEYDELKSYKEKFHDLINDKTQFVTYEFSCGAGWGCYTHSFYSIPSGDEGALNLANKLKTVLYEYSKMPFWKRVFHRDIPGGPYQVRNFLDEKSK